ncbi:SWIM zinc finger family protein [Nonomuraea sp. H19]|uniref:SWIM zinc finger family protein n=1 Tax=Nonomuraea sp. H19 TaxID=3452206 RepID=UPI003F89DFC7
MIERWSRDQVLALAPDAPSQKAAQGVAAPGKWSLRGTTGTVLYGACKGSGTKPYLACVDLTEPAYRCNCPSRKFPCKHALGLLLLWSADGVPVEEAAPQWVTEWVEARAERAAKAAARMEAARAKAAEPAGDGADAEDAAVAAGQADAEGKAVAAGQAGAEDAAVAAGQAFAGPEPDGGAAGQARAAGSGRSGSKRGGVADGESVRHARVASGLAELERWLADQVRQGLAGASEHDWDGLAKRLIDAQAPGVAGIVSRLSRVRAEDDWPGRLLEEYALINLLAVAYRRRAELPAPLAQTVLIRTGFPVTREQVLTGSAVRDLWDVLGRRDDEQDRLTARRVWLRGRRTGRPALILSFAPQGQALDASLVTGTTIEADVTFYQGAAPLRALVATRYGAVSASELASGYSTVSASGSGYGAGSAAGRAARPASPHPAVPPGVSPEDALDEVARAVAEDPWTESWPLVLAAVTPERASIGGLPLHPKARDPWRLIAVSGGQPLTVAVEWTPQGLRPLTTWDEDGMAVIL